MNPPPTLALLPLALLPLGVALLQAGCTPKASQTHPTHDTGDTLGHGQQDAGTTTDPGSATGVELNFAQSTIATTGVVTWSLDPSTTAARVDFGVADDTTWIAQATLTNGRARAILVGMRPGLTHTISAYETGPDGEQQVGSIVVTAGSAPGTLSSVTFATELADRNQLFMITSILSTPSTPVIMNSHGEWVWWHEPLFEDHLITRAWIARDGTGVRYLSRPNLSGDGANQQTWLVSVDWTGDQVTTIQLEGAHHDFLELKDGTLAYLSEDVVSVDGTVYIGDRILELSPDGDTREIWSVWDDFNPVDDEPDTIAGTTWSHANALDYNVDSGIYAVSLRNFSAIVGVARDSGKMMWQIGGDRSDYAIATGDEFIWQHQFEFQPDGSLLVFDNGNTDRFTSRAIQYNLNSTAGVLSPIWQYVSVPSVFCFGPGDVHRLDNGNTLITWGSAGRIEEIDPGGTVIADIMLGVGGALGFTSWTDDLNDL